MVGLFDDIKMFSNMNFYIIQMISPSELYEGTTIVIVKMFNKISN